MSTVEFKLQTTPDHRPGVAVAEVWPAFTTDKFEKRSFVIPYGGQETAQEQRLDQGSYWVQVSLPSGELVKKLINIPSGEDVVRVVLESMEPARADQVQTPESIKEDYPLDRLSENEFKALPSLPERAGSTPQRSRRRFLYEDNAFVPFRFSLHRNRAWLGPAWSPFIAESEGIYGPTHLSGTFDRSFHPRPLFEPRRYLGQFLHEASRTSLSLNEDATLDISELPTDFLSAAPKQPNFTYWHSPRNRQFVLVPDGRHACLLVCIPDDSFGAAERIRLTAETDGSPYSVRATVEVAEPRFDSLLRFMNTGDNTAAMSLIEDSTALLYAKFENPYAAAAAGYVLIRAAPGTLRVPWQEWIGNLGRYFDNLPDGDILHATLLLQRGDAYAWTSHYHEDFARYFPHNPDDRIELAAHLTLRALVKGPPIFRPGLSLLASNLRILRATLGPDHWLHFRGASLPRVQRLVTWMSMRVDPREIFTVLRLS